MADKQDKDQPKDQNLDMASMFAGSVDPNATTQEQAKTQEEQSFAAAAEAPKAREEKKADEDKATSAKTTSIVPPSNTDKAAPHAPSSAPQAAMKPGRAGLYPADEEKKPSNPTKADADVTPPSAMTTLGPAPFLWRPYLSRAPQPAANDTVADLEKHQNGPRDTEGMAGWRPKGGGVPTPAGSHRCKEEQKEHGYLPMDRGGAAVVH